jgi:hypothetical protein
LGHHAEAKGWFEQSLALTSEMGTIPVAPLIALGHATRMLGELDHSRQLFCQALERAIETQRTLEAQDALVGLASLSVEEGDPAQAAELLVLALQHPATMQATRERAQDLLSEPESTLSPELSAAATARGLAEELEDMAAEIVGGREIL